MKIMLLTVTGGYGDYIVSPWRRIVSVEDEIQFLAAMRLVALQELQAFMKTLTDDKFKDEVEEKLLSSVKLRLTDLGLDVYPESPEEQARLYAKVLTGEPI
jgi:hypothetical protein